MHGVRVATWLALSVVACSSADNRIGTTRSAGSGGTDAEDAAAGGSTETGGASTGGRSSSTGGKANSGGTESDGGGAESTGGAASGGTSSGGTSSGGTSSGGTSSGGASSGGTGGRPVCQSAAYTPKKAPVDVYVMFDQSSSMSEAMVPPATGTWWTAAQAAFISFVNDSEAAGIGVGLQFFPLNGVAPNSCTANYSTPAVPIAALPGNAAALTASMNAHQPTTFTPTGPALAGAVAHMKSWAGTHPGRYYAVLLVTDGFPTECEPQQITDIATIAKNAFETAPSVQTHVVGLNLGAGKENLNPIAKAGGTGQAIFVNGSGAPIAEAFLEATLGPRSCSYPLPTPPPNQPLRFDEVNVRVTPRSGAPRYLSFVNTMDDCLRGGGWLYDNRSAPKQVVLCPQECQALGASTLEILLGCKTVVSQP